MSPSPSGPADIPDDWLFGKEPPSAGSYASAPRSEDEPAADSLKLPARAARKRGKSTFVASRVDMDPDDNEAPAPRRAEKTGATVDSSSVWRDHLYWLLLVAISPLAISTVWPEQPLEERLKATIQPAGGDANRDLDQPAAVPDVTSVDAFFAALPGHRIAGAHLARDTWMHWAYATVSAVLFLALLTQMFPNDAAGFARLMWTGLITGTVGIILLLGFQWVAAWTQTFNLRGRSIVVLLFYIVKFIGFSYRAALDPENGFLLSFMGFTCGVGLCEELCKAIPVVLFLRARPHAGWRAACVVGLASGVGFGVSEGVNYSSDSYNGIAVGMTYLVRFASCVALHSIWAGAVALVINRNQDYVGDDGFDWEDIGNFLLHYLLAAMVLHGLYDTLLKKDHELWALSIAAGSFAWLAWLVWRERSEE
ncbi:MAG: PrsW family intramembrane metalloprotease [Planctomycetia bacterium]|nr:PrsW family intramembrane metalloprotease [Planctomycetia bacterium]